MQHLMAHRVLPNISFVLDGFPVQVVQREVLLQCAVPIYFFLLFITFTAKAILKLTWRVYFLKCAVGAL